MSLDKLLQARVPRDARFALRNVPLDRLHRSQTENMFRVDRVRVAPQGLDPRDAEGSGAKLDRGPRRWSRLRANRVWPVERAGEGKISFAPLQRLRHPLGPRRGRHALQEARGYRGLPAAFLHPAQDRLSRAKGADEIVRSLTDAPFRRGQAERCAHRPVEKRVGLDRRRPDSFVEAGQKHAVEAEQTRFEQAEDLQARVPAAGRRGARRGERILEQGGIFAKLGREALGRGLAPFVHELDQLLESVRFRLPRRRDRVEESRRDALRGSRAKTRWPQGRARARARPRHRARAPPPPDVRPRRSAGSRDARVGR